MINSVEELKSRLAKIEKCNLNSEKTRLEEARVFCYHVVKTIFESNVPSKQGAKVFKEFLADCIVDLDTIPEKFMPNRDKSIVEVSNKLSLDLAVGIIGNMALGDEATYNFVIEKLNLVALPWLNNQREYMEYLQELVDTRVVPEMMSQVETVDEPKEEPKKQPTIQVEPSQNVDEVVEDPNKIELVGIYDEIQLMFALYSLDKIDFTSENTTEQQVMAFCKQFMNIVAQCHLEPELAAPIFKIYLQNNCFYSLKEVPEKFMPNINNRLTDMCKMQSADYAFAMMEQLAKGTIEDCNDVLVLSQRMNSTWLQNNQANNTLYISKPLNEQSITTAEQLIYRLYSIDKVNVCDANNSQKDVKEFCNQFVQVIADCKLSPEQGAQIVQAYLVDCFDDFNSIPQKFAPNQNKSMTELSKLNTQDYAISIIGNLSTGSQTAFKFATTTLTDETKTWLDNQKTKEEELDM